MRHLFVAKFFEPSYAKALTNHFERPDPCGVVLALGDTKGRFSVIRTGLFFLSHGLAIRRLLLSVTPENAPEGTLAPADGSEHSQPRDEPRTGWSGAARPAPPKHQAAASPLECRFELPRSGPRGTPALGRDFRGWSGSGVIRRRGNGRGRRGLLGPTYPLHALQRRRPAARRAALQRRRDPTTAPTRRKLRQQNGSVLTVFVGPVREN
jgi:hypothetical protein